jgi:hypothetical protein
VQAGNRPGRWARACRAESPCSDQNRNVKVREIAELVIAGITGQPPQESPFSLPG